jgi:hypothetical protein
MKRAKNGRIVKLGEEETSQNQENRQINITFIICCIFLVFPWVLIAWGISRHYDISGASFKLAEGAICGRNCTCTCPSHAIKNGF